MIKIKRIKLNNQLSKTFNIFCNLIELKHIFIFQQKN